MTVTTTRPAADSPIPRHLHPVPAPAGPLDPLAAEAVSAPADLLDLLTSEAVPAPADLLDPLAPEAVPFRVGNAAEARQLLAQGLVRPVVADVLVAVGTPDSQAVRIAAIGLLLPPEARLERLWVIGFASAAWFHTGTAGSRLPAPAQLQVIVPPGRRRPRAPGVRGRQVALDAEHVIFFGDLAVTTPVRTAADVARDLPDDEALAALRRLGEVCDVRPHQVIQLLTEMRYARGVATGRALVNEWAQER